MSRVTIEVKVNTDMVPGWGYDPQDFVDLIQRSLNGQIPHYEPVVTLKQVDAGGFVPEGSEI